MTDEASPQLDQLIAALSKKLNLTTTEIADILWLALKSQGEGETSVIPSVSKPIESRKQPSNRATSSPSPSSHTEQKAKVYTATSPQPGRQGDFLPIKLPDASSLRQPLKLARALRPLMQKISSGTKVVIDEQATAQRTAENSICIPVFKPALEPWFDLALVVDESKSMIFWRKTIQELQQLLEHCGAFRDVRTWGLVTNQSGKVVLQRGTGKKVRHRRLYDPRELIDPTGQRLILVVSDCVGTIWRNGEAVSVLEKWVKQNPVAIVQMLPEWLWLRTGLSLGAMVQLGSSTPGVANQNLRIKDVLLWDDINFATGIKVPVFTLEPEMAATWSEMVMGKSYARATGFVFPSEFCLIEDEDSESESADSEELVNSFRLTASPMARKLASLLSAAPVITLPIVRLIQQTMLRESQQVHVAEVFLGGILKLSANSTLETNPGEIQFVFIDEENSDDAKIRDIFLDAAPETHSLEVLNAISEYFAKRLGKTLREFYALLRKPEVAEIDGLSTKPFAWVTAKVLKRLGGDYARFAFELEEQWKSHKSKETGFLKLIHKQYAEGQLYQTIQIPGDCYFAAEFLKELELPLGINFDYGVVIDGKAPNWLYGYLTYRCQKAAWVGCYYPQLEGAVVVHSNTPTVEVGQVKGSTKENLLNGELKLEIDEIITIEGARYQSLAIHADNISPQALNSLSLPSDLDWNKEIVLWGQAPVWLYAHLVVRCQQAQWVSCYNMKSTEAIVVVSNSQFAPGDKFRLVPKTPCPAILFGGPPNAGKSVLAYNLKKTLLKNGLNNKVYLHRVAWDGEGDWFAVMMHTNPELANELSKMAGRWKKPENLEEYFSEQAEVINKIRTSTDLVLVEFGGMPREAEKLLLSSCTHYIIISNSPDAVEEWHKFFQIPDETQKQLIPLAVIHSVEEQKLEVVNNRKPYLEIVAGPWNYDQPVTIPQVLLEEVMRLIRVEPK